MLLRGRDRMLVGFTTTYMCNQYLSPLSRGNERMVVGFTTTYAISAHHL